MMMEEERALQPSLRSGADGTAQSSGCFSNREAVGTSMLPGMDCESAGSVEPLTSLKRTTDRGSDCSSSCDGKCHIECGGDVDCPRDIGALLSTPNGSYCKAESLNVGKERKYSRPGRSSSLLEEVERMWGGLMATSSSRSLIPVSDADEEDEEGIVLQLSDTEQELTHVKEMLEVSSAVVQAGTGSSMDQTSFPVSRSPNQDDPEGFERVILLLQNQVVNDSAMKSDQQQLRAEKSDMLAQMQQLYATLEEKDQQLRNFIRSYETRVKESEDTVRSLAQERETLSRERGDMMRRTHEAEEQVSDLHGQLGLRENRVKELEAELSMAKQSLAALTRDSSKRTSLAASMDSIANGQTEWPLANDALTAAVRHSQQASLQGTLSSCNVRQSVVSDLSALDRDSLASFSDPSSPRHRTHSLGNSPLHGISRAYLLLLHPQSMEDLDVQKRKKKKERKSFGSLTRVFGRGKQRRTLDSGLFEADSESSIGPPPLSEGDEGLSALETQLELTRCMPISSWKASTVQVWLENLLHMPMYVRRCAENVKSGKVLLGLSNEEFETALGITNPLHKRKLRMAIEDYRDAESGCGLSQAAELDTLWVTTVWLPELGLPQHAPAFRAQLIDGRLLRTLTRRDLEKQLHVTRRQHQQSVLCGMVLLRRVGFNKQVLIERRKQCENEDHDIIVWTNQRVVKWLRSIDLHEYADNLTSSGVHGALLVLEPSFSAESLATVLGIPTCKGYLRRHLVGELQILVGPARSKDERQTSERERKPTGCVEPFGRQFVRSNSTGKIIEEDGNVSNNEGKPSSLGQSDEKMMAEALSACEAVQYSPQRRNSLPSSTDFEVCQV
uniref:kazrin-like isoform X2 n=1 Tax=Myxine glutinosa TaxID=7769 RepID=UPI00358EC7D0